MACFKRYDTLVYDTFVGHRHDFADGRCVAQASGKDRLFAAGAWPFEFRRSCCSCLSARHRFDLRILRLFVRGNGAGVRATAASTESANDLANGANDCRRQPIGGDPLHRVHHPTAEIERGQQSSRCEGKEIFFSKIPKKLFHFQ